MANTPPKCTCETPTPWEDVRGNRSNMCKSCNGRIESHRTPEIGALHTRIDRILLGEFGLDPDHPFITYLVETMRESLRTKKSTWDYNDRIRREAVEAARRAAARLPTKN